MNKDMVLDHTLFWHSADSGKWIINGDPNKITNQKFYYFFSEDFFYTKLYTVEK